MDPRLSVHILKAFVAGRLGHDEPTMQPVGDDGELLAAQISAAAQWDTDRRLGQPPGAALVDRMMDAYCDWRTECVAVRGAYALWSGASASEQASAFDAYRAALDREERAATVYQHYIGLVAAELTL